MPKKAVIDKDLIDYFAVSEKQDFSYHSDNENSTDYDSSKLENPGVAQENFNDNLHALEETCYDQINTELDSRKLSNEKASEIVEDSICSGLVEEDESDDDLISDEKWHDLMKIEEEQADSYDLTEQRNDQITNSRETLKSNDSIYPGHNMTVHDSMVLILLDTICHSVSGAQLADLLTLISVHCLQSHVNLQSIYMFKKYFANMLSPIKKHFFCRKCMSDVDEFEETCHSCGKR